MTGTSPPLVHRRSVLLLAVLIVLATQALVAMSRLDEFAPQGLIGPDSYMRMLRIEKLFDGDGWYDRVSERTNAPYGETLQWGRPLDIVLYGIAYLAAPFTDARDAVYLAGVGIGPLIALLMIPAWSWATRPFLGGGTFLMIFVLTPLLPNLMTNLRLARADHHGFLALLFIVQLAAAIHMARGGRGPAVLLGIAGGVAVWASVVAWVAQGTFACVLAYLYLRQRNRISTRDIFLYAATLATVLTIALPIERPPADLVLVDFKRLSIVHWTLAASAAATWGILHVWRRRLASPEPTAARLVTLLIGGAVPLTVVGLLFPKFFLGPLADYDPGVARAFLSSVAEFQPLLPRNLESLSRFFLSLGAVVIAAVFILYDRRRADAPRPLYEVLLIGLAIYVPLALWIGRFALYAQCLALPAWALATARIMEWTFTVRIGGRHVPVRALPAVLIIVGPIVLWAVTATRTPPTATESDWAAMEKFLTVLADRNNAPHRPAPILFTYLFKGPEIAWRTPYRVVGAPYDNTSAIRDTRQIFRAGTDEAALRVIDRRGVGLLLYCRRETENGLYRVGKAGSLLSRIENDSPPVWLSPVPLPDGLASQFRLYRVVRR